MNDIKMPEYPFIIRHLSKEEGGGFLIEFPDLPGCMTCKVNTFYVGKKCKPYTFYEGKPGWGICQ